MVKESALDRSVEETKSLGSSFFTDCLNPEQQYVVSMSCGTLGYAYTTYPRNFLSYAIYKVLFNVDCKDVTEFSKWGPVVKPSTMKGN